MKPVKNIVPLIFTYLLLFAFYGCSRKSPQIVAQKLNSEWQFRNASDTVWSPAKVPGTVQTDLFRNKLIPDPFYGTNESKLQWIGKKDWIYKTRFDVADNIFNKKHIEFIFNGLDTYAEVRLNNNLILNADNMFRTWKIDCKKFLRKHDNTLTILFRSPLNVNKARFEQMPYKLAADNDRSNTKVSIFTRKAPYQFGWDWGPRFVTCGIWRPVGIVVWDEARINDFQVYQQSLTNNLAQLKAVTEVRSDINLSVLIQLFDKDSLITENRFNLKKGENYLTLAFQIRNPKLWWTNGLGEPHLYHFSVRLEQEGKVLDKKSVHFGIRTLEIVQKPDAKGKGFYVKLNGVPVFMKGANYIPQDNFLPRVSKQKYKALILAAKNVNMNMLLVWGGGIYENNEFYDLCDENGILVWQDFMFACSFYPGDSSFLNNVKQEAIDNVKRLRNHPCLALWCGNNEVQVAWERWGYQKKYKYSKADSVKIYGDYLKLFHHILPQVVSTYDPGRFYWPSSPNSAPQGWDQEARSGDMHYWGVWWGRQPFSAYEKQVGRFMNEYGFQSMPAWSTLAKIAPDTSLYHVSPIMRSHNKHPDGYTIIDQYMRRNFRMPKDFKDYILVSQLLQAEGMKTAIEAHRRARPWCMGSLYWQLNDCWPVVSWSGIDYYGHWKALQYRLRKLFAPVLVSPVYKNEKLNIYLISDLLETKDVVLKTTLMDFYGKQLWQKKEKVKMTANASKLIFSKAFGNTLKHYDKHKIFLHVEIRQNDSLLAENNLFFAKTKDLVLHRPRLQYKITNSNGSYEISITSKVFVKYVVLDWPDDTGIFSDNYFPLLPNRQKVIRVNLKNVEKGFRDQLKIEPFY